MIKSLVRRLIQGPPEATPKLPVLRAGHAMRVVFFYPGEEGSYVDNAEVTVFENGIVHLKTAFEEATTSIGNCEVLWQYTSNDQNLDGTAKTKLRMLKSQVLPLLPRLQFVRRLFLFFGVFFFSYGWASTEVVSYVYDSWASKSGAGPALAPLFEKATHSKCTIKLLPSGDASQMLGRIELDAQRKKLLGLTAIGIDGSLWKRSKPLARNNFPMKLQLILDKNLRFKIDKGFIPLDYGPFAFIADVESLKKNKIPTPKNLRDLLKSEYKKNFLLQDPRTSSPGLAFVRYAFERFGSEAPAYFKALKGQWLTLAPGWDASYELFLKGEAPLVWSYVTSEAYHIEEGKGDRYKAVLFDEEEGHPTQVEGAFALEAAYQNASATQRECSDEWLLFLVSEQAQAVIAKKNWMFPARTGTPLPASFKKLRIPKNLKVQGAEEFSLAEWTKAIR